MKTYPSFKAAYAALLDNASTNPPPAAPLENDTTIIPSIGIHPSPTETGDERTYENTHDIASTVAFLAGVKEPHFSETGYLKRRIFDQLQNNTAASIMRHLCLLRNAILQKFGQIHIMMREEGKSILSLPELVPIDSIDYLSTHGITVYHEYGHLWSAPKQKLVSHLIDINRYICDKSNLCQNLFHANINWKYIRELFIMPNGLTPQGTKKASDLYYSHQFDQGMPYNVYLNWTPTPEVRNLFISDIKFLKAIYASYGDTFNHRALVVDVKESVKEALYKFLESNEHTILAVDCDNIDYYTLTSALLGLDTAYLNKISKTLLFIDPVHASESWKFFEQHTSLPSEEIFCERLIDHKSTVDGTMISALAKEHWQQNSNSFIIASSDSDYWSVVSCMMSECEFIIWLEKQNTSPTWIRNLEEHHIPFFNLSDFHEQYSEEFQTEAILKSVNDQLKKIDINLKEILNAALFANYLHLPPSTKDSLYNKHLKPLSVLVNDNGKVEFKLKI